MPSVVDAFRRFQARVGPPGLIIIGGVFALFLVRELPPDASLSEIQEDGVLVVCTPPAARPLLKPVSGGGFEGREAEIVRSVANVMGVRIQWNPQHGWGSSIDPVDWGMRPSACDLVAGGVVASEQTEALLQLVPYAQVPWAFAGDPSTNKAVGLYLPFWGLDRGQAARWLRDRGYGLRLFFDGDTARDALRAGEVGAILSLRPAAQWLAGAEAQVTTVSGRPKVSLAVGTWKGRTTLNRAVQRALR